VEDQLHESEDREQHLAHPDEQELHDDGVERDRGRVSSRVDERGEEAWHADDAGDRKGDPHCGVEGEGGGATTSRRRHEAQPRGIGGIGPAVGVETRGRLVVDVESDAHSAPRVERTVSQPNPIRERAVDGEWSPSPTQQRTPPAARSHTARPPGTAQ
jgi:hypothetical protein